VKGRLISTQHESVVAQAIANLVLSGYRLIDPDGIDVTDVVREEVDQEQLRAFHGTVIEERTPRA
jgi:hypothetical protein